MRGLRLEKPKWKKGGEEESGAFQDIHDLYGRNFNFFLELLNTYRSGFLNDGEEGG